MKTKTTQKKQTLGTQKNKQQNIVEQNENSTVIDEDVVKKEGKMKTQQEYNMVVSNQREEIGHHNGIQYNPDLLIFELASKIKKLEAEKQNENGMVIDEDVIPKEDKLESLIQENKKLNEWITVLEMKLEKSLPFDSLNSFLLNEKRTNIYIDGLYDRFLARFKPVESK